MIDLSFYEADWEAAETAEELKYVSIPDGTYAAKIESAEIREPQGGGRPYVGWGLQVALPDKEVVSIYKTNHLSDKAMPMLKRDLKVLGIEPGIISPLNRLYAVLEFCIDSVVEFTQKSRENPNNAQRPYVNHNFTKLIRPSGKTLKFEETAGMTKIHDDDLPF